MVEAPGEAEATCAALCSAGLVRGVATSDGDALLYGAERVYQVIKLKARDLPRACCPTGHKAGRLEKLNIFAKFSSEVGTPMGIHLHRGAEFCLQRWQYTQDACVHR